MEKLEKDIVKDILERIRGEIKKVIIEQDQLIDYALISLISGGHVLLEGVPGLAKTLMVKALAKSLDVDFKRIQFTPDLMPADITGTPVFNLKNSEFEFKKGPIFTNFLLADEINRTPPKTQSGLLEAIQETTVSIDGKTHELPKPFMVFATQNPLEYEGTYPLPEALVDRFLMKLIIDYPSIEGEQEILKRYHTGLLDMDIKNCEAVCTKEDLYRCINYVKSVNVESSLMEYIVTIIAETRKNDAIEIGSSPRGSLALMQSAKGCAAYAGRDYVIPEDIKEMAIPTLRHRVILKPELELEGILPEAILKEMLDSIKVPR